jgi:hypothetical protein
MGSFPIVASGSLDSVYDGLLVVSVSRREDFSAELLIESMVRGLAPFPPFVRLE